MESVQQTSEDPMEDLKIKIVNSISHGNKNRVQCYCENKLNCLRATITISRNKTSEETHERTPVQVEFIRSQAFAAMHSFIYSFNKSSINFLEVIINDDSRTIYREIVPTKIRRIYSEEKIPEQTGIQFVFNKQVEVLMEEYKTLREEIVSNSNARTNMFYYGLVTLGIAFGAVQTVIHQLNSKDVFIDFNINQINSLKILLLLIMSGFIPGICIMFLLKWISNARAAAYIAVHISRLEKMVNQSFSSFQDKYPSIIKRNILDLNWETNLRYKRRASSDPNVVFGGSHIVYVTLFFTSIGFISQLYSIYTIGIYNKISHIVFLSSTVFFSFSLSSLLYETIITHDWYLALPFEEITIMSRKKSSLGLAL
ncbi:MAG: hypothetical protein WA902_17510, partial [Thermosynechococcaceae cyanobacterium]